METAKTTPLKIFVKTVRKMEALIVAEAMFQREKAMFGWMEEEKMRKILRAAKREGWSDEKLIETLLRCDRYYYSIRWLGKMLRKAMRFIDAVRTENGVRIAVYGTLRRGGHLHKNIRNAKFIGTTRIPGYRLCVEGYVPFALPASEDKSIVVEVYDVSLRVFGRIFISESPNYKPKIVQTEFGPAVMFEGVPKRAFCDKDIPDGDFIRWIEKARRRR